VSRRTPSARVVVYGAEGCHLCETALRVVEKVRVESPFELEVIDITGDDDLERRFRARLPVVLVDDEEVFTYFVHPDKLRQKVDRSAGRN
jgi:glutaredoxin